MYSYRPGATSLWDLTIGFSNVAFPMALLTSSFNLLNKWDELVNVVVKLGRANSNPSKWNKSTFWSRATHTLFPIFLQIFWHLKWILNLGQSLSSWLKQNKNLDSIILQNRNALMVFCPYVLHCSLLNCNFIFIGQLILQYSWMIFMWISDLGFLCGQTLVSWLLSCDSANCCLMQFCSIGFGQNKIRDCNDLKLCTLTCQIQAQGGITAKGGKKGENKGCKGWEKWKT